MDYSNESNDSKMVNFHGKRVLLIAEDALVSRGTFASANICVRIWKDGNAVIVPTKLE